MSMTKARLFEDAKALIEELKAEGRWVPRLLRFGYHSKSKLYYYNKD